MPAKILKVETAYSGWCKLMIATIGLPDGRSFRREIEDHGRAASVLPFDPVRRTAVVIRQLRAPPLHVGHPDVLEAIAGLIDDDEPMEAARREAMEEAGLRLAMLQHVTTTWPMPGLSTERLGDMDALGIRGKDATPYLLGRIVEITDGESLKANIALVEHNARLGAAIAREHVAL